MINKRYSFFPIVVYAFFVSLLLGACSDEETKSVGGDVSSEENSHDVGTAELDTSTEVDEYTLPPNGPMGIYEGHIYDTLTDSLSGDFQIQFDDETLTYNFLPNPGRLDDTIEFITQGELTEEWDEFVYLFAEQSRLSREIIGDGYTFKILNPHNPELMLVSVKNGIIIYNFSDDY